MPAATRTDTNHSTEPVPSPHSFETVLVPHYRPAAEIVTMRAANSTARRNKAKKRSDTETKEQQNRGMKRSEQVRQQSELDLGQGKLGGKKEGMH
jgi:hypothetical protein